MAVTTALALLFAANAAFAAPVDPALVRRGNLPTPIAASTARSYLSQLTVEAESNSPAYDRDLFNHWITISGSCNARETVLKRDGTNVQQDSACAATSGNWYSDYDGETFTVSSELDIDHMVPLKEAWVSGAKDWTDARREQFANDLTRPQLIAVSASSNRGKGDQDPAEWLPEREAYHCTYVRAWVQVKYYYDLSVDSLEKAALSDILSGC
ncbi:hypothetical protein WHR41_07258 [Cladosporium halotolerans]|uniref:GmrSD restriction endonucleases C-terminal domain-containing protein n=1 Tax=Cladosporium halotolerans TaxID=1052096 RepID=A0AB34KK50_9PEZI